MTPDDTRPSDKFTGRSDIGQMDTGPEADAISILQRVRDGLLAYGTEGSDAA